MNTVALESEGQVAIAASFVAEPIEQALRYWLGELDMAKPIAFASYNQVLQQLLDPLSLLGANRHGSNVVLVRPEDWLRDQPGAALDAGLIERNAHELVIALKGAAARGIPHFLFFCPASPRVLADAALRAALERTENLVAAQLNAVPGVHVATSAYLASIYPVPDYHDEHADKIAHIPYTPLAFTAFGTALARKLHAPNNAARKLIVLDGDRTLWDGVCGEDGPHGIQIGAERMALQHFMLEQHDAGMLLGLCSANNEEDLAEVFRQRADMPLTRDHFAVWRVNWQPKSENIRAMAEQLNVGLDSIVFIDDDDVACAEVRAHCPQVMTLQLPRRIETIPRFLRNLWLFDRLKVTGEAGSRTAAYRHQARREQLRQASPTLEDFIAGLDLRCEMAPLTETDIPRVAELTQRTNQFNLTTLRRSEAELQALCLAGQAECLVVRVSDRLGDYGLVGALIFHARTEALEVESFLLSCRALGRGVEYRMLAALGDIARQRGLERVDLDFVPTQKNRPAREFLNAVSADFANDCNDPDIDPARTIKIAAPFAAASGFPRARQIRRAALAQRSAGRLVVAPPEEQPQPGAGAAIDAARFSSIAVGCCDAEQIHRAISSQARQRADLPTSFVAPRSALEKELAAIWSELLGIDQIGVEDNFFDLGGHSLSAMQMISRIRDACKVELSLRSLFSDQFTIANVALMVIEHQAQAGNQADFEELLSEINALSDEEVRALLAEADPGKDRSGK
jgi:FkbH-like protein